MDDKCISVVVLLDMIKAFNSLRHDILLAKFHGIGISSSALSVRTVNALSQQVELSFGVLQGNFLGIFFDGLDGV